MLNGLDLQQGERKTPSVDSVSSKQGNGQLRASRTSRLHSERAAEYLQHIRALCQKLIETDENSQQHPAVAAELRSALSKQIERIREGRRTCLWRKRGGRRTDNSKNRIPPKTPVKELTDLIEKKRDRDKLTKLNAELNALPDEQKKPPGKLPTECLLISL